MAISTISKRSINGGFVTSARDVAANRYYYSRSLSNRRQVTPSISPDASRKSKSMMLSADRPPHHQPSPLPPPPQMGIGTLAINVNTPNNKPVILPKIASPNSMTTSSTSTSASVFGSFLLASTGVSSLSLSSASKHFLITADNRTGDISEDANGGSSSDASDQDDLVVAKVIINVDLFEIFCIVLTLSLWIYLVCRFYVAWRKYACVHASPSRMPPSLVNLAARRLKAAAQAKMADLLNAARRPQQTPSPSPSNETAIRLQAPDVLLKSDTSITSSIVKETQQQSSPSLLVSPAVTDVKTAGEPSLTDVTSQQRRVRFHQAELSRQSLSHTTIDEDVELEVPSPDKQGDPKRARFIIAAASTSKI